jgi:hypothetical protein
MKTWAAAVLTAAVWIGTAAAQTIGQDASTAGHATADASKQVAHKTASGTKTVAKDTAHGTKVGADKTADATKTGYHKTVNGTKKVGDKIAGKPTTPTPPKG